MNKSEVSIAEKYQKRGWEVVRGGAPDFLLVKRLVGRVVEVRAVEVKADGDNLQPNQIVWAEALGSFGIPFVVARVLREPIVLPSGTPGDPARGRGALDDFVNECCDLDEAAVVTASELRDAYVKWCRRRSAPRSEVLGSRLFGVTLHSRFERSRNGSGRMYHGLVLKDITEEPQ